VVAAFLVWEAEILLAAVVKKAAEKVVEAEGDSLLLNAA
jgi:hypothetical protein